MRVEIDVKSGNSCEARAAYHARLDTLKQGAWTNARDVKWVALHTTGDHVVDVDR